MKKRLVAVLAVILCMSLLTVFAMGVSATEQGTQSSGSSGGASSTASVSSVTGNSSEDGSSTVSSDGSSEAQSGTGSDTSSGNTVSSGSSSFESTSTEQTSSGDATSSGTENTSSGTENTSSGTTSSRVNRPIQSTGQGGNNFIDQDGDQLASQNASTSSGTASGTTSGDGLISDEYVEDDHSDTNFFQGKATTVAQNIYKVIWIPILLALICIAALVFVNIWFNKKYPKPQKAGAKDKTKKDGPHRRKKNKKFKFTIED